MYYVATLIIVDSEKNRTSRPQHLAYISDLYERGHVLMGGPFEDGSGGMVIYQNVDQETAERLAHHDPAVTSGARTVSLRPWRRLDLPIRQA
ncbi:YciI family protein [Sulfobacillus harzensis]|uniref:YCII-related domain-containing protein n=1 Tax=Sulfobacillus harzensis TaxID=2729629 RepID=A0A7Y0L6I0_9FIRM|nr:YciI family protein [Sulfobacillus harzensis]NMP24177.1 hypothetical protein [Sulfobacillus harzensis]